MLPQDQWEVLITVHHSGYICWEEYLGNQQKLHANCPAPAGQGAKRQVVERPDPLPAVARVRGSGPAQLGA